MKIQRRQFMKASAAAAAGAFFSPEAFSEPDKGDSGMKIQKRKLGNTGQELSIVGMGGIVVMNAEPAQAAKVVAESVERGINYFDVAPTYGDAELKLGPALKPFRKEVFLACKTAQRSKDGAKKQLDASLERLQTDHFDLYQLHAITDVEKDVKAAMAKDGAIQTFIEAKKQGIIKYIGFSAHSPQAALAAMAEFDFDTILYPINFCMHFKEQFDQQVLEEAKKRNMGILALKGMAMQKWPNPDDKKRYPKCWYEPIDDPQLAKLAFCWTLGQGICAALPPGEEKLFRMGVEIAENFEMLTDEQVKELSQNAQHLQPILTS